MGYQVKVLPTAQKQIKELSKDIRIRVLKRLQWLEENGAVMIHHPSGWNAWPFIGSL